MFFVRQIHAITCDMRVRFCKCMLLSSSGSGKSLNLENMSKTNCCCLLLKYFLFQENFGSSLSVMMKALNDLQRKGDLLVKEVKKQKTALDEVNSQILTSQQNLTTVNQKIKSKELHLSKINTSILQSKKLMEDLGKQHAFSQT